MSDKKVTINLIPFLLSLLGCVLVVIKVLGLTELGWIWILCPFWIGPAVFISICIIGLVVGIVVFLATVFVGIIAGLYDIFRNK